MFVGVAGLSWRVPLTATMIPAIDQIDTYFTTTALNRTKSVSICAAAGLATKTLNCYYSLTDSSEVYWIVMGK
jgi:hypothetical protein